MHSPWLRCLLVLVCGGLATLVAASEPAVAPLLAEADGLDFRRASGVSLAQWLTVFAFLSVLVTVALTAVRMRGRHGAGDFAGKQRHASVLERQRLTPRLHLVVLQVGARRLLVFDNGTAISVVPEPGDSP